jgi:hypothetical protein
LENTRRPASWAWVDDRVDGGQVEAADGVAAFDEDVREMAFTAGSKCPVLRRRESGRR